jgi:TatD DNase family protein
MKFIDTHTHVNLRAFKEDAHEAIQRALDAGVAVVNVGTQIDTSREAVALLEKFPNDAIYAVIGLHPSHTYTHDYEDDEEVKFKTLEESFDPSLYEELVKHERVVGIGECGLDYYRLPEDRDHVEIKALQRAAFDKQIKFALDNNKALCIHCRPSDGTIDAYEDLLAIITKTKTQHPQLRFEVHCYTGDAATALKFVELGGFIGLNGIITFDKTARSREVVEAVPLEYIILETDAPYLTPKSHRGQRNEPSYLPEVAQYIAEWKNVSIEEVADQTTANAKKLFNI